MLVDIRKVRSYVMNRILSIDDDKELCTLIKRSVCAENIEADICNTGREGIQQLKEQEYQLVILDVMMPGMDGFETLEEIRKEYSLPILMFTAKNDSASKVKGLRAGADDYLTKPFDMDELIARIVSLIRRYTTLNPGFPIEADCITLKDMVIDKTNRMVFVHQLPIELTGKEFDLLSFLASNKGQIFTKKQIYTQVWEDAYAFDDSNIMSFISKLRKKIEPDPEHPFYILTVRGVGYRFNREA